MYLFTGNPKAAMSPPLVPPPPPLPLRLRYAPRPLWADGLLRYRAGALAGERHYRCLSSNRWYQQRHRRHEQRYRFHGLSTRGLPAWPAQIKPLAPAERYCSICGGPADDFTVLDAPAELDTLCFHCLSALLAKNARQALAQRKRLLNQPGGGRRARYARPAYSRDPLRRLRESRQRPAVMNVCNRVFVGLGPRRRTLARLGRAAMHYLAARRAAAAQCRRRGFEPVRPGIWYDRAGDVVYIQTCTVQASETIRRAVA